MLKIKNIILSRKFALVFVAAFLMSGFLMPQTALAAAAVTPATGGTSISIDATSAPGGAGDWMTLIGPVIQESFVGEIGLGVHTLTLPVGWEFNTVHNVTIGVGGATELTIAVSVVTPTATTISFNVTALSTAGVGSLTFNEIQVRPTGTTPSTGNITLTAGVISGINGSTNFGMLSTVAGAATQARVETAADGTGTIVPTQSITANQSLTVYAVRRDQFANYIDNATVTWSLPVKTGGVADGDLVGGGVSAVFNGNLVGTGIIRAAIGGLTSVDSGTITVVHGAVTTLTVNQAPISAGSVDIVFSTQPWILVTDSKTNPVDGTIVAASLVSGAGTLRTALTATSGVDGLAKFTDLGYSKTDAFQLHFAAGALSVDAVAFGPLAAGAAAKIKVETLANGSGVAVPSQNLVAASTLTVYGVTRDQFDNYVGNPANTVWSLTGITGNVVPGDLTSSPAANATMTGNLVGTAIIHATNGALTTGDSGTITVVHGALTGITVAPDTTFVTADQTQTFSSTGNDANGNTWDVTSTTIFSIPAGGDGGSFTGPTYTPHTVGVFVVRGTNGVLVDDTISLTITPGIAAAVTIGVQPAAGASVDVAIGASIAHIVDQHGNNVAANTSVAASKASGAGTLSGTLTATTSGTTGNATFSDLHYNKIDAFTIKFTSNSHDSAASNAVTLSAGAAIQVNVEAAADGSGSPVPAQSITADQTVTGYSITRDQFDNFVANAVATWSLPTKTGGVLDSDLAAAGDNKSAIFSGNVIGTGVIRAAAGGLAANDSGTITVTPGVLASITVSPDTATVDTDHAQIFTAEGFDSSHNTLGDVTSTTIFSIPAGGDGGSFTGPTYTPHTVGVFVVRGTNGALVDDTISLTVTPGAATHLTVSGIPVSVVAGVASSVTVTAKDQYNNTATGYAGTIHFTSTDVKISTIIPTPDYTFVGGDNGAHTFTGGVTLTTTGVQTITATDTITTSITGVQTAVTVTHGGLYQLNIAASPTSLAVGASSTVMVYGQDFYSNTTTNENSTRVYLNVDNGGHLGTTKLTLTAGIASTTVTNASAGTTLVSVIDLSNPSVLNDEITVTFNAPGAPVLTVISAIPGQYAATINYISDTAGKGKTDYGKTAEYGLSTGYPVTNNMATGANSINLGSLDCNTVYHYKVFGKNSAGMEAESTDAIFTTAACPASAPTVTITAPTAGASVSGAAVTVSATNGVDYQIDGGAWTALTNAWNTTGLANGSHTIHARSAAPVGYSDILIVVVNNGNVPAFTWTTPAIGTTLANASTVDSTYTVTNFDTGTVQYSVNGSAWAAAGDTTKTDVAVQVGANTLQLKATKTVSGVVTTGYSTINTFTITAATIAPVTPAVTLDGATIVSTYSATEADTRFTADLVFSVGNTSAATINGASAIISSGKISVAKANAVTVGAHSYDVIVTSATGHTATLNITYQVNADSDTTAPAIPVITTANATIDANTYVIAGTVTDDGASRTVTLYNGSEVAGSATIPTGDTTWSILISLIQGSTNVFTATASDIAGNTSALSAPRTITETTVPGDTPDTTAPATPVITTSATTVDANDYTVSGTAGADLPTDGTRTITIYRNIVTTVVGSITLLSGQTTWSFVAPLAQNSSNVFTAVSTDESGNNSAVSNSVTITEATAGDTTAPVITSISTTSITQTSVTINWTTNENSTTFVDYGLTSDYDHQASSGTLVSFHHKELTGLTANTTYHFRVKSVDAFGNTAMSDDQFFTTSVATPDSTNPPSPIIATTVATVNTDYYTINGTAGADTPLDGSRTIRLYNGITLAGTIILNLGQTTWSIVVSLNQSAANNFTATSTDAANNTSAPSAMVTITEAFNDTASLAVTNVSATRSYAAANNTFTDGWQWVFDVTVPTSEASLSMKFEDFISGTNSIPAASNIQYYSAQSNHTSASPIIISAANTYTGPIDLTGFDLDATKAGRQIQITVEVKVPTGTAGGSYSASYGIKSY